MDSKWTAVEEVIKRVEACEGTKQGRMLVKGTLLVDNGEEIIRTSFDNTTSSALVKHTEMLRQCCENFVRERNTSEKLEFVRADYRERATKDSRCQIMMAVEDDFKAIVLQEYRIRDLRERPSQEQRDPRAFKYVQKNYFYPSVDK